MQRRGEKTRTMDPPPNYEKQLFARPPLLQPPAGPAPAIGYGAPLPMPPQYQPYYIPPPAGFNPSPSIQPSQPATIPDVQLTEAPDYLAYSIFTSIFCCFPLGIAALYYSLQTRKANRIGDFTTAKKNSNLARSLAHSALGVGFLFIILCIIIVVVVCYVVFAFSASNP
ncbi:hypothetical protein JD844_005678 [Phrynosoma platyrhinos]|uniref:Proline-rich transmembrane protein 1 n=1 Tax=Phrynosoma platyrhinos TaxID=52577 RepID=A0ABQ7TNJ2_PHRPL|nr:hypothetical protein JD844_005678 [Phrynosoma platyrhinos]